MLNLTKITAKYYFNFKTLLLFFLKLKKNFVSNSL